MAIKQGGRLQFIKQLVILVVILLVPTTGFSKANDCQEAGRQLQGNFEVTQSNGGLWGYFERSEALKDRSMLGMQVDSKLQRMVVIFKDQCDDASTPPPDPALFKKIGEVLDIARTINNKSPHRTPPDKIAASVQDLAKELDDLLKNLGQ